MGRVLRLMLLAVFVVVSPVRALAQGDARALAVQLFDEAEGLFTKGEFAAACPKYAESYRLDPQLGALIHLADCYEKNQQLASAWGSFREAEELAQKRGDTREAGARERALQLEPRVARLLIEVPEAARIRGLTIVRDGAFVAPAVWGTPAAIDPGPHQIEVSAPGYQPWQTQVSVAVAGGLTRVPIPVLSPTTPVAPTDDAPATDGGEPGRSRRVAAVVVGGVGLVSLGVAGFFGLSARSSSGDSDELCNDDGYCLPRGTQLRKSAKDKALVSTITGGVGIAALVTSGVLWFTAPRASEERARRRPGPARSAWLVAPLSQSWGLEVQHAF